MSQLTLERVGPIADAAIKFGDLTLLVGPQSSGKSIALQWLKLALDCGAIQGDLRDYGLDWDHDPTAFMSLYFGEGLGSLWSGNSRASWNSRDLSPEVLAKRARPRKPESVFLVPAQRVLALRGGWPRPFGDYAAGDPYVVRAYSESLRRIMEQELRVGEQVFPRANRLKAEYRAKLAESVFSGYSLEVVREQSQKRLVLSANGHVGLPYMVWSAGQREFVPLLLGLYWLMPPAKVPRRQAVRWVVIEEPEMGLHPRAISTVLLLAMELLHRGYKVCISTHSTQVVELAWVLRSLKAHHGKPEELLSALGARPTQALRTVAASCLKKSVRAYYFDGKGPVRDFSTLDPADEEEVLAAWGGLAEPSERSNAVVARAVSYAARARAR